MYSGDPRILLRPAPPKFESSRLFGIIVITRFYLPKRDDGPQHSLPVPLADMDFPVATAIRSIFSSPTAVHDDG